MDDASIFSGCLHHRSRVGASCRGKEESGSNPLPSPMKKSRIKRGSEASRQEKFQLRRFGTYLDVLDLPHLVTQKLLSW